MSRLCLSVVRGSRSKSCLLNVLERIAGLWVSHEGESENGEERTEMHALILWQYGCLDFETDVVDSPVSGEVVHFGFRERSARIVHCSEFDCGSFGFRVGEINREDGIREARLDLFHKGLLRFGSHYRKNDADLVYNSRQNGK